MSGMTDEDWAAFEPGEREFALRWLGLSEAERDAFCRQLLDAIEVLQRFRVLDDGSEAATAT
jgi:hypothetical protein